jgi:acetyl-CoA carboxylase, biotin carboxylase subunit
VYLESFLDKPRHIEVQVLGDEHDRVLSLGERDCSLQRRYQKLVEESPAPNITKKLRDNLTKAAVRGAKAIHYTGAGTVEFLVDDQGRHYFAEMNTRIQVEHPVTEMVTGVDLVQWQIRIAAGEKLTFNQKDIEYEGHSIEVRINAEDAMNDFAPSGGMIDKLVLPGGPGVRVDSHLYQDYKVPTNYDSLLGKIIVWGDTREAAIARMRRALAETIIDDLPTTVPFYQRLMLDPQFIEGHVTTHFIPEFMERIGRIVD